MVSRVRLTADVFGGMPQGNAETYLNTTIYQLRKSLEPHGFRSIVVSNNDSYGLELTDVYIDFVEFEDRLKRFEIIDASNLDQAIELEQIFVGDLFGEKAFMWALNDIERISKMYSTFVKRLVAAILKRGEGYTVAIRLLLKLLSRNELDEENVSLLLDVYAAKKDKAALSGQYAQYVRILYKELGISPSQELADRYSLLQSMLD